MILVVFLINLAHASDPSAPWLLNHSNQQEYNEQALITGQAVGGEILFALERSVFKEVELSSSQPQQPALLTFNRFSVDPDRFHQIRMPLNQVGGLQIDVPYGIFEGVTGGRLFIKGDMKVTGEYGQLTFRGLRISHSNRPKKVGDMAVLDVKNAQGQVLFELAHIHTELSVSKSLLSFNHMDVHLSSWMANQLQQPELAGRVVGRAKMVSSVSFNSPDYIVNKIEQKAFCDNRPLWPTEKNPADVALIELSGQLRNYPPDADFKVLTPSARLKNVGAIDVPWYQFFTGNFPPYNNDQHPYLIWNLYKVKEGRFTQIAASAMKHAFFTTNSSCSATNCGNNHILWPECEDLYGVSSNDNGQFLGPREELNPFTGIWNNCGSFFNPGCTGSQTVGAGANGHRMIVKISDLNDPQAQFYLSAWYVIRDDNNINNSMGSREMGFVVNGNQVSESQIGVMEQGPAADRWISTQGFDVPGMTSSFRVLRPGAGQLSVKTKVIDLGGGLYRYHYFVENYDYNPALSALAVPMQVGTNVSQYDFNDVDDNALNDWPLNIGTELLQMTASNAHFIDWGYGFTFSMTLSQAPLQGSVRLTGELGEGDFWVPALVPQTDLIFADGF
ncbi:MAG: hypothetical protein DWP95_06315 [Proteobacteria bacterium]|nr:MAG: hypothetical protein DWP95_06315 [Pseudomonadota bacterium]